MNPFKVLDSVRDRIRRRRWLPERALAVRGEELAMRLAQKQRYQVVARNYRPRAGYGEIDLIAWDRGTLVFIEVKTRTSDESGSPERAVGRAKQEYLVRTAREYCRRTRVNFESARFDVVTVLHPAGGKPALELYRDAFRPY